MTPEEFRRHGYRAIDWIADYLARPERYPVLAQIKPGELTDSLPAAGPERGEPMEAILDDFERQIVPAVTHWNHPGFMAYFAISGSEPGILGELLATALNLNGMLWKSVAGGGGAGASGAGLAAGVDGAAGGLVRADIRYGVGGQHARDRGRAAGCRSDVPDAGDGARADGLYVGAGALVD